MLVELHLLYLHLVESLDLVLGTDSDVSCCLGELCHWCSFVWLPSLALLLPVYCSFGLWEGNVVILLVAWSCFLQSYCIKLPLVLLLLFPGLEQRNLLPIGGKVTGSLVKKVVLILAYFFECLMLDFFRVGEAREVFSLSLLARYFLRSFRCCLQAVIDICFSLPISFTSYLPLSSIRRLRHSFLDIILTMFLICMRGLQFLQDSGLNILDIPQYLLEVVLIQLLTHILLLCLSLGPAAPLHRFYYYLNLE